VSSAIRTRGLTKRYGDFVAVDHLDLEIRSGEVFGLLGPNGAGKTTTILMLLGLSEPSEGDARVLSLDPARQPLEVKRRVGYLPDAVGFYENLTGRENLRYTARLNGIDDAERVMTDSLRLVGLTAPSDDLVGTYSRGMRQRLGIADALLKSPEVLILDEPTVSLDPEAVQETLQLIRGLASERGVTVLLSSHLLHQVQSICDRVAIFVRGRVVAQGRVGELAAQMGDQRLAIEVEAPNAEPVLRAVAGVDSVESDGDVYLVRATRDCRAEIARALSEAGIPLRHLTLRRAELDEIYRRYFEEGDGESSTADAVRSPEVKGAVDAGR
jgi:ABC-2 type transport system ATP-binding protein